MLKGMKNHLKKLLKGEIPLSDVYYYFQGHLREKLYYSKCKFLIRKHIQEQFEYRMKVMDKDCYLAGQCKICECSIPALTFCNKVCYGSCYPVMMSKSNWNNFKKTIKHVG